MNAKSLWAVVALIVLVALGVYGYSTYKPADQSGTVSSGNQGAVEQTVTGFGAKLQTVSLLAPDAGTQIQTQYGAYVAPELLAKWEANPTSALGRTTSSPWPEKISIVSITPRASGKAFESYQIEANVVEVVSAPTSTGAATEAAGVYPLSLTVEKRGEAWLITNVTVGAYSELPQRMTITGIWECLPYKGDGPHTMECAFGIAKDQSDGHYAVDTSLMSTYPVDYPTGAHIKIEGIVTPVDQLSSVQKYDIDGIIRATSITKM